ncbi:MAG: YceI family protein [Mangrovibacterium sp.]
MNLNVLIFILLFFYPGVVVYSQAEKDRFDHYLFDEVVITGSTNMNQFSLNYKENGYSAIPAPVGKNHDRFVISIPAGKIKAESKMMLHDFLEMINARQYPVIAVTLEEGIAEKVLADSILQHQVGLTINGITNRYDVRSLSVECDSGQRYLSGEFRVNLSNFNIDAPRKFFGLVKVEDEVLINFKILFSINGKGRRTKVF